MDRARSSIIQKSTAWRLWSKCAAHSQEVGGTVRAKGEFGRCQRHVVARFLSNPPPAGHCGQLRTPPCPSAPRPRRVVVGPPCWQITHTGAIDSELAMQPTGTDSQQKEASIDFPNHCSERDFYVGAPEQAPLRGEKSAARAIESQFQTRLNTRKFINLNP